MKFDPDKYHRHSIRLKGYDYSQSGAYFITICAHNWECLLGTIVDEQMMLNDYGRLVETEWMITANIRNNAELDAFVAMPNHIHGIIRIARRGTLQRAPTRESFGNPISDSIPTIIRLFKSTVTKQINRLRDTAGAPVWQRNYYEHVVRDKDDLFQIRRYIVYNPAKWDLDQDNPANM